MVVMLLVATILPNFCPFSTADVEALQTVFFFFLLSYSLALPLTVRENPKGEGGVGHVST